MKLKNQVSAKVWAFLSASEFRPQILVGDFSTFFPPLPPPPPPNLAELSRFPFRRSLASDKYVTRMRAGSGVRKERRALSERERSNLPPLTQNLRPKKVLCGPLRNKFRECTLHLGCASFGTEARRLTRRFLISSSPAIVSKPSDP